MISIPIDLVVEISSRLPAKSIARFLCVSKLWSSMFHRPYFTELFLKRSSARPRLLFALHGFRKGQLIFYSSPQSQNLYEKQSSLEMTVGFHIKFPDYTWLRFCGYASGLICFCFRHEQISKECEDIVHVICNPSTGQYATLPKLRTYRVSDSFLGFDPIDKQFKVLSIVRPYGEERDDHRILTLVAGNMSWRNIQFSLDHVTYPEGICINGVLYYLAVRNRSLVIVCFDVRSEKFRIIDAKCFQGSPPKLINHSGRLGGIHWQYGNAGESSTRVMCMWVLEDLEKQEWSKYVYTLPGIEFVDCRYVSVAGMTATGEVVLSMRYTKTEQFYVFYFNPERNTLQLVDIQDLGGYDQEFKDHRVYTFVNHVEDLSGVYAFVDHVEADVNVAKQLNSSQYVGSTPKSHTSRDLCSSAPSVKNKQPTIILQNKFELLANLEYWSTDFGSLLANPIFEVNPNSCIRVV